MIVFRQMTKFVKDKLYSSKIVFFDHEGSTGKITESLVVTGQNHWNQTNA